MKTTRRLNPTRLLSLLRIAIAATLVTSGGAMAFVATRPASREPEIPASQNGVYIVQMLAAPAVSYSGGIAGYNATAPHPGRKIDPLASDTVRYVGYLKNKHDEVLGRVGGAQKIYDYAISYNGFAARLTAKQAAAVKKMSGVLAVTPDEMVSQDTSSTPHFLGLDAPGGIWEQLGGPTGTRTHAGAGENIVIGVVDSGIWPQSRSFSTTRLAAATADAKRARLTAHGVLITATRS
jgi:peptidase inhibitor I9